MIDFVQDFLQYFYLLVDCRRPSQ